MDLQRRRYRFQNHARRNDNELLLTPVGTARHRVRRNQHVGNVPDEPFGLQGFPDLNYNDIRFSNGTPVLNSVRLSQHVGYHAIRFQSIEDIVGMNLYRLYLTVKQSRLHRLRLSASFPLVGRFVIPLKSTLKRLYSNYNLFSIPPWH